MVWDRKIKTRLIILSIILVGLLSSCSSQSLGKLWLKSEGWSRGTLLGETSLAAPAASAIDSSGKVYTVLFPKTEPGSNLYQPILITMAETGEIGDQISLDFQTSQPKQSKIILSEEGIDLFWIDSYQLKSSKFSQEGELLSEVRVLSGEEIVSNFEVMLYDSDYEIWYAGTRDDPGLYALSGKLDNLQKSLIDSLGTKVDLVMDSEEQIHISWVHYPKNYGEIKFYYLKAEIGLIHPDQAKIIYKKSVSPSKRIDGPVIGIDQEVIYYIWSDSIISGLEAGMRTTYYQYFPIGFPDSIRPPMRMSVPAVQDLDETDFISSTFETGDRILIGGMIPSTASLQNVEIISGQSNEIAVVYRSRTEFKWRDFRNQVNVAYLSDGLITTYQPLSYTSAESYYPTVFQDQENDLYVTWSEKGESAFRVYLTTTDLEKKLFLDQVSFNDYLYLSAEGLFGILAGAVLAPFAAAVWGGAGIVAFLINSILSRFNHQFYRSLGEFLSILVAIFIFWVIKFATLPGLKDGYVPFSGWIPRIPPTWETLLVLGVPIFIGLISLILAWVKTYGKESGSPINFYLIYAAMDTLLSCAVYGILIYG